MTIKCDQCGYENSENYRFCGMCGAMLHAPKVAEPEPQRPPAPPVRTAPPVSGPSFLGLDSEKSKDDVTYLLEDEEVGSGRGRMVVALVILFIAAGVLVWRYRDAAYGWFQKQATGGEVVNSAPVASGSTGTPPIGGGVATGPSPSEPLAATTQAGPSQGPPPPLPSADEAHTTSGEAAHSAAKPTPPPVQESAPAEPKATPAEAKATPVPKPLAPTPKQAAPADNGSDQASAATAGSDRLVSEGEKYLYGNGVPEDCHRAQKDLQKAASQASSKAMSILATMYATGHCVNPDLPNAYRWFAKAMHQDPSNPRLQQNLEVLWRQMSPAERQIAMQNQ